jgi:hypothetical protein
MKATTAIENLDLNSPTMKSLDDKRNILQIMAGVIPFIVVCITILSISWPQEYLGIPNFVNAWFLIYSFLAMNIGIAVGYAKSFPRWSFPYFGFVPLFAMYLMNIRIPPSPVFGLLPWIPVMIALIIGASISGIAPIKALGKRISDDWTLLVYAPFGAFPIVAWIMFDEVNRQYKLPFLIGLYLFGIIGAICYLLCSKHWQRVLILFLSIYIIAVLSILGPDIFWHNQIDHIMREVEITYSMVRKSLIVGTILTIIPFFPGLLVALAQWKLKYDDAHQVSA